MPPMWVTGWGGGPMSKVTVHLLLEEMRGWILTKLDRNQDVHGGGPQGPKLCKFQTSSPDPVKVEQ